MSGDHSQALAQLADIHGAAEPSWWPLAPGWWMLIALLILACFLLIRSAFRRLAVRRRRQAWIRALEGLPGQYDPSENPHGYLAAVNRLFRAVALRAFPDTGCARLEGEAWVSFLSGLMPEGVPEEELAVLARGPYEALPDFDAKTLERLARTWVARYG